MNEPGIVNASPLILLSRVGRLELLRSARAEILLPEPVLAELRAKGGDDLSVQAVDAADWLRVIPAPSIPDSLAGWTLGAGEAAVLAAALERPGALALLDDRAGRRAAESLGVLVMGTAGLVLRAKRRGAIPACRPVLESLIEAGMYITDATFALLLSRAGE